MLLALRNGSVWSLNSTPERKYLHALQTSRLKPYNGWLMQLVVLATIIPSSAMFILVSMGAVSIDPYMRVLVEIALAFVAFPIALAVLRAMSTRPLECERMLHEVRRGFVEDLIPDTAYAYQLIKPAIAVSLNDPTRQSAISGYFHRVRKTSNLNAWWTPNWWLEFQQTHDERLTIYHAATLLMDRCPEFRPLLSPALGEFERQLQSDYATGLRKDIATKQASIGSHEDKIRKEQNAIASLREEIRDQELALDALQPFNKE